MDSQSMTKIPNTLNKTQTHTKKVNPMTWSGISPGLNTIEHLLRILKVEVRATTVDPSAKINCSVKNDRTSLHRLIPCVARKTKSVIRNKDENIQGRYKIRSNAISVTWGVLSSAALVFLKYGLSTWALAKNKTICCVKCVVSTSLWIMI